MVKSCKILDTASPSSVVISSSDSSDGEEDGYPLSSITVVEAESDSFLQEDIGITSDLVSKAIRTIDNTTSWTNQNDYGTQMMATEELQFIRTVLGRLECSFARQEAKMDRILTLLTSSTSLLQTPLRPSFTPVNSHFTTPLPTDSSAEFPPPPVTPRPQDVEVRCPDQSSSMCSPMEDGTGTVAVGGNANVRLTKSDYNFAKAASKPTVMSLRLVDHLFTKDTLTKSTVQGTKEFSPLDRDKLDAIKTEVLTAFSYQCRGMEDVLRMWEQCKTSIGKRCQNLRKNRAM
nr:uncharacterized protein LOC131775528 [Pocillopora verrucosa]